MPASSLPETRLLPIGSGQMPGRPAIPMPESSLTTADLVSPARSEIVRDPRTGKFKKIFTGESVERPNIFNSEKGAVPIGNKPKILGGVLKKILDKKFGWLVKPSQIKNTRRDQFHSLLIDDNGNIIDLGEQTHFEVLAEISGVKIKGGFASPINVPDLIKKHKLIRLQHQQSEIAVEIQYTPTPLQIETLAQIFEANPKMKASYDIWNKDTNHSKIYVSGADLIDKIFEVYSEAERRNAKSIMNRAKK